MFPRPIEHQGKFINVGYRVALYIAVILWLIPLAAVLMTSIRSIADINAGNYWGWPDELQFIENYTQVFIATPMARYLLNSLLISLPAVAGAVALSTLAGFALAKYKFKGNVLLFAMFIGGNFVPFQILMIPVRDLTIDLGLYDTHWALIFFHVAFQAGFCTLFMRNFMIGIPDALIEAARVEGVSEWRIFWYVVLPLVRPALAALSVLVFTFIWNDFFWALVLVQSDEVRPVTAGLNALQGQWLASWQYMSAGAVIAALPPVALFFTMQRHFIAGLTLGATKG
ncbi:carbohydrate ABC transporter permease [Enterovibrio norvegicus]|uniref:sn-glycerol-3-phosphate transport system permease protein UgpE n=2 Tax=Enterovibrio norvegicus TaxID=188144 RepID=A0A2N7LBK5_9GAMM|nr:carbohydrate ABC transporter permease [Enterovibrio norvegicus]MCC4798308.1 carbohydrate ABC transporter permease [Enterovibrio norvegicus]OEE47319.1 sugar ABC transporter permease [Enterovibrio norvegicus]OEF48275.1 sugar ABC transporter permease [Enterovibrio norvegicus]OEF56407.1 sugar ABC transporter permease [Enterovibrio norvegicus]PMH65890.1 sugar ABC transporter permease [Enterovibrio norvegicus]